MNRTETSSIIIGKLLTIGALLEREGNRLLSPFNLNHQQFSILYEIFKAKEVKQKDIVNRLLLERSHLSKVVKKLVNMNLIVMVPTTEDKRSSLLSLTSEGKSMIDKCMNVLSSSNVIRFKRHKDETLNTFLECVIEMEDTFANVPKL